MLTHHYHPLHFTNQAIAHALNALTPLNTANTTDVIALVFPVSYYGGMMLYQTPNSVITGNGKETPLSSLPSLGTPKTTQALIEQAYQEDTIPDCEETLEQAHILQKQHKNKSSKFKLILTKDVGYFLLLSGITLTKQDPDFYVQPHNYLAGASPHPKSAHDILRDTCNAQKLKALIAKTVLVEI